MRSSGGSLCAPQACRFRKSLNHLITYNISSLTQFVQKLASQHDVDLVLCVAAAQRRGIADADEARRNGKDADNLAPGFRISGLGQLIDTAIEADRLVTFGD